MKYPKAHIVTPAPKAPKDAVTIPVDRLIDKDINLLKTLDEDMDIQTRDSGSELKHRALYLSNEYDWVPARDPYHDELCLIPLRRKD